MYQAGKELRLFNTFALFWVINGIIWIVAVIVTIIVDENPEIIEESASSLGGLGIVIDGHVLLHYVPGIMIIVYMGLEREIIGQSVFYFYKTYNYGNIYEKLETGFFVIFMTLVMPMILFIIYVSTFNIQSIYGYTMSTALLIFIGIVTIIILNTVPYLIFFENYVIRRLLWLQAMKNNK